MEQWSKRDSRRLQSCKAHTRARVHHGNPKVTGALMEPDGRKFSFSWPSRGWRDLRAGQWQSDLTDRVSEKMEEERFRESDKDPTHEKYVLSYTYSAGGGVCADRRSPSAL